MADDDHDHSDEGSANANDGYKGSSEGMPTGGRDQEREDALADQLRGFVSAGESGNEEAPPASGEQPAPGYLPGGLDLQQRMVLESLSNLKSFVQAGQPPSLSSWGQSIASQFGNTPVGSYGTSSDFASPLGQALGLSPANWGLRNSFGGPVPGSDDYGYSQMPFVAQRFVLGGKLAAGEPISNYAKDLYHQSGDKVALATIAGAGSLLSGAAAAGWVSQGAGLIGSAMDLGANHLLDSYDRNFAIQGLGLGPQNPQGNFGLQSTLGGSIPGASGGTDQGEESSGLSPAQRTALQSDASLKSYAQSGEPPSLSSWGQSIASGFGANPTGSFGASTQGTSRFGFGNTSDNDSQKGIL